MHNAYCWFVNFNEYSNILLIYEMLCIYYWFVNFVNYICIEFINNTLQWLLFFLFKSTMFIMFISLSAFYS